MTEKTQAIKELKRKDKVSGKVLKTTLAGALVDIGAKQPAVIPISQLQKDSVRRVEDILKVGETVEAWVRRSENEGGRIELTLIEPIQLEWKDIKKGMSFNGKVGRIEKFGAFIELGSERPGLVHVSEMSNEYIRSVEDVVKVGEEVEVHVLEVDRRKKQIKLSMKGPQIEEEIVEEEAGEPAPTAMESALRKAMSKDESPESMSSEKSKAEPEKKADDMEDILSRTLENRVKST